MRDRDMILACIHIETGGSRVPASRDSTASPRGQGRLRLALEQSVKASLAVELEHAAGVTAVDEQRRVA